MLLPDGTILMHEDHAPYDAQKAHQYYMDHRKLKGRKKGTGVVPASQRSASAVIDAAHPAFTVTMNGHTYKMSHEQLAQSQEYVAKRVTSIKKKLHELNAELKKRMAKAKEAERKAKKPDSAAEKAKKAKDSEKYRDKHKQELKNKAKKSGSEKKNEDGSSKHDTDTIDGLKATIKDVQGNLKQAIANQRALSSATGG